MKQTKRDKLKEVLRVMKGDSIDFSAFDNAVTELRKSLEDKVAIPTLERVNTEIEKFREKIDFTPLLESLETVKRNVQSEISRLSTELSTKLKEQQDAGTYAISQSEQNTNNLLSSEISALQVKIASLDMVGKSELQTIEKELRKLEEDTKKTISEIQIPPDRKKEIKDLEDLIEKIRVDLLNRLAQRGGGNMNRQVLFNSVDRLTRFTDYNIKPGTNVSFTVAENTSAKRVDLTINATGGSGSGITRVIESVAVNTTAGDSTTTDYVYLCTGTITVTLPTAVGNSNLYTIKNVGTGVVTVDTTGGETIDDDLTVVMPVRYTSVDIISNDTSWKIT